MPEDIISYTSAHWAAPPGVRSIVLRLALPYDSLITSIGIVADAQGYTQEDRLILSVRVMETMKQESASFDWDTLSYQPDEAVHIDSSGTPRHTKNWAEGGTMLSYSLGESVQGGIVYIRASLSDDAGPSARIHIGKLIITGKPLLTIKSMQNGVDDTSNRTSPTQTQEQGTPPSFLLSSSPSEIRYSKKIMPPVRLKSFVKQSTH